MPAGAVIPAPQPYSDFVVVEALIADVLFDSSAQPWLVLLCRLATAHSPVKQMSISNYWLRHLG